MYENISIAVSAAYSLIINVILDLKFKSSVLVSKYCK